MESKDFRIGNYVNSVLNNEIYKIDLWALRVIQDGNYQNSHDTETKVFEPIPLTEEWLIKFGFKEVSSGIFEIGHLKFKVISHKYGIDFHFGIGGKHWIKPHYVHAIQNLYFALTGHELEIK